MDREGGKKEKERGGGREREIKKEEKKRHTKKTASWHFLHFTSLAPRSVMVVGIKRKLDFLNLYIEEKKKKEMKKN